MSAVAGASGPVVRRSEEVVSDRIDGAIMLVHVGTADFYRLNDTGAAIWDLCDGHTANEMIAAMQARYPGADRERMATLVRDYLPVLASAGLVVFTD